MNNADHNQLQPNFDNSPEGFHVISADQLRVPDNDSIQMMPSDSKYHIKNEIDRNILRQEVDKIYGRS